MADKPKRLPPPAVMNYRSRLARDILLTILRREDTSLLRTVAVTDPFAPILVKGAVRLADELIRQAGVPRG